MRRVRTFFYGSFMNPEVLAKAEVRPAEARIGRLDGWDIRIAPRATLSRATPDRCASTMAMFRASAELRAYASPTLSI